MKTKPNSRPALLEIIIRKTGIPAGKKSQGYLDLRQMKALIVYIETTESKINGLTREIQTLTENFKDGYGKDKPRPREPKDI